MLLLQWLSLEGSSGVLAAPMVAPVSVVCWLRCLQYYLLLAATVFVAARSSGIGRLATAPVSVAPVAPETFDVAHSSSICRSCLRYLLL